MKYLFLFSFLLITITANAQQKTRLKEVISLVMPDDAGARAASLAWHPVLKRYYAPKSGNADYVMAIFDAKGKLVSPPELKTNFDIRGFWYNPKLKTFCANGYNDNGWITYTLDKKGIPVGINPICDSMCQPYPQSVGSFDVTKDLVYFLDGQQIVIYSSAGQLQQTKIRLHINYKNEAEEEAAAYDDDEANETPENINNSVVVYTGMPKAEFALLDFSNKTIQLYDKRSGFLTKKLSLPANAPVNEMLCFSYCNNIFWLFDMKTKTWKGYK